MFEVSGQRAAQLINQCRAGNRHFICHKSPAGREIACRGVHEMQIGQMSRIAERLGAVVAIDPDTFQRVSEPTDGALEALISPETRAAINPSTPTRSA